MGIVFFCQSCGARFEVAPQMAGKKGRCKKCGQFMEVPRAENLASMAAMPALAAAGVVVGGRAGIGVATRAKAAPAAESMSSWLRAASISVGLDQLTVDNLAIGGRKKEPPPTPLDDAEDSKPYAFAVPATKAPNSKGSGAAGAVVRTWRREVGAVQKFLRTLNQLAYVLSMPFVAILLFGVAMKGRNIALFGATFVVLLNLARIVAGIANLAVIPLRDGLNARNMKKPFHRVLEPVVTIGLVVVAFTLIPWLKGKHDSGGTIAQRLKSGATSLGEEMKGEVGTRIGEVKGLDVETLGAKAQKLGADAQEKLKSIGTGPDGGASGGPQGGGTGTGEAKVRGLLNDVEKHSRETIGESQP